MREKEKTKREKSAERKTLTRLPQLFFVLFLLCVFISFFFLSSSETCTLSNDVSLLLRFIIGKYVEIFLYSKTIHQRFLQPKFLFFTCIFKSKHRHIGKAGRSKTYSLKFRYTVSNINYHHLVVFCTFTVVLRDHLLHMQY